MIKEILEALKQNLTELFGVKVLFDPQPVKLAEPHVRLTFSGSGDQGDTTDVLRFQLSVIAAGDGPEVFLSSVIGVSLTVHDICKKHNPGYYQFTHEEKKIRMHFEVSGVSTGQFVQNAQDENEQSQFRYTYVEPHSVVISFNNSLRT